MKVPSISDAALSLWDYYYLSAVPSPGDEAAWRRIECASNRIHESLGAAEYAGHPAERRVISARRVRRAARECSKLIESCSEVGRWPLLYLGHQCR